MKHDFLDLLGQQAPAVSSAVGGGGAAVGTTAPPAAVSDPHPWRNKKGRPPGSGNRLTTKMREALVNVYERNGGDDWFAAWANAHPTEFFKLIVKAVPKESELQNRVSGLTVNVIGVSDLRRERKGRVIDVRPSPQAIEVQAEPVP